jgi:hypothetical protein
MSVSISTGFEIQKSLNVGFDNFNFEKDNLPPMKLPVVDYEQLIEELQKLITLTQKGYKTENFHSLFIFGPTGNAKTAISELVAKQNNFIYHKLEIQKIPLEEFCGFPYLKTKDGKKVVKLAHPTDLPTTGDSKNWLLHLDEFNKADAHKMAAVMNLVLTGEIGGTADYNEVTGKSEKYKLPEKTLIVGCGNFREQDNVSNLNLVNSMDTATSERFHRAVFLEYNAESWLKSFALKEYAANFNNRVHLLSNRILPIITYYIMDKSMDEGNKAPFTRPIVINSEGGGTERTTSPRMWTIVSDRMLLDGLLEFEELKQNMVDELKKKSEKIYGNEGYAFDLYLNNPNNQVRLLSNQGFEFGLKANEIIIDIVARYRHFFENRIMPDDIIYRYASVRNKIANLKSKVGLGLNILVGVGYRLCEIKDTNLDPKLIAVNLSTFIEDVGINAEDLMTFIYVVGKSKNNLANETHNYLISFSEKYKRAFADLNYSHESEIEKARIK